MAPRHKLRCFRIGLRLWIGAGDQYPIIPTAETQRFVDLLRRVGDVTIRFLAGGTN